MRSRFDEQLAELNATLSKMAALVQNAIARATEALVRQDKKIAEAVITADDEVDSMEKEIERLCLMLLLQQQPVAGDLRRISAALKISTDLERVGDHAVNIAEWVLFSLTGMHKNRRIL
ncbi:MAG: hypothetical protein FWD25_04230 [Clostridia bacterium]|nr:hypothetical protein [Clostridia bacterium]